MKLLHVITSMHPKRGGPPNGLRNLYPYLIKEGVEVDLVTLDDDDETYSDNFTTFKLGKGKTAFYYNSKLYPWLITNLINYDVVSAHGLWQYHNYAIYKAINYLKENKQKIPKVVIMPHGMLDPYFQKAKIRQLKAWRNEIVWLLIEKKAINAVDAIFFTCQEELQLATKTFKGYHPKQTINVGYGIQHPPNFTINMAEAFYALCPKAKQRSYWLFLSRVDQKKGIDVLINAYQQLSLKHPTIPHLVIAGNTESTYAKEMIKLADNHPHIHFLGILQGDAKWGAFYNCEAFVLPSHQENFGIAIVEAMACKKTVVITKHINIWREIEQGDACLLFNTNKTEDVYQTLEQLYKMDRVLLNIKGEKAYNTFKKHFYIENTAKKFAEILNGLFNDKGNTKIY